MSTYYAIDNNGNYISALVTETDDHIKVRVSKEMIPKEAKSIYVSGENFKSEVGEEGYYLCGCDFDKYSSFLTYFKERENFEFTKQRMLMNVFGIKNSKCVCVGCVAGMEHEYEWKITKKNKVYSFGLSYDLEKFELYEDIEIILMKLPEKSSYIDMAKRYRRYMIEEKGCQCLSERQKKYKELDYLKDSVEIRIRMAWKPAPADVLEQTVENEPDIHVACTFDEVKNFIKELKKSGVEKAEICLIGWNKSGHDGRWPTAFPVEPLLGGEEKLRELNAYAKECGYKIICHTNSTDCYSISEKFNDGEITVKDKLGQKVFDPLVWSGGTMYHLCPKRAWEIAQEKLPKISELGFLGAHYIDVISVVPLKTCYDKNHPCNAKQSSEYYERIAMLSKKLFGGFSSEGTFDHAAKYLDFGLYTKFNRERETGMDDGVNFWEIVYHGIIMSNAGANTVNYPIKTPEDRLLMAEFNYRPAFYVYATFMSNGFNWMGDNDLKINTDEDLKKTVEVIKKAYDEYSKISYLQTAFIENYYKLADNVFVTEYSDGTRMFINYTDKDFKIDNIIVPAMDYKEEKKCYQVK